MLDNLSRIKVQSPVDLIISQIKDLISSGSIKEGEKLPPERKLAEHLGVSRTQVRDAINKLQFYGIVTVQPQSGTIVNGLGVTALEGLFSEVLRIDNPEFKSLIDTRILLEKEAARLAALNRTSEDLVEIKRAFENHKSKLEQNLSGVEEDLLLHLQIATASKNTVLKSLMNIITPDIVANYNKYKVCNENNYHKTIEEHQILIKMIEDGNADGAVAAMNRHLSDILQYSLESKNID